MGWKADIRSSLGYAANSGGAVISDDDAIREQLIQARADIAAQLLELRERAMGVGRSIRDAPPHFGDLLAELEGQLAEIDALLSADD